MATLTSFFGGGGGVATTPASGQITNLTYLNNTVVSVPSTERTLGPNIVPLTDDKFFLLSGNSTSKVYVSLWSIASNGSCTIVAAPIQLSTFNEVGAAAANGTNALMVVGGTNYDQLCTVTWDGATTLTSSVRFTAPTSAESGTCAVGCLYDGTLLGCVGYSSSGVSLYTVALTPEGSTITRDISSGINFGNYGRSLVTGSGLYWVGQSVGNSSAVIGGFATLGYQNSGSLMTIEVKNSNSVSDPAGQASSIRPPFMYPTKSGGVFSFTINNGRRTEGYVQENEQGQLIFADSAQRLLETYSTPTVNNAGDFNRFYENAWNFCRQYNGSYILFKGGSGGANQIMIEENTSIPTFTSTFKGLRHIAPTSSGITGNTSTAVVGNYVVKALPDSNVPAIYLNTWQI